MIGFRYIVYVSTTKLAILKIFYASSSFSMPMPGSYFGIREQKLFWVD